MHIRSQHIVYAIVCLCGALVFFDCRTAWGQQYQEAIRETDRHIREKVEERLITPPKKPPTIKEEPEIEVAEGPKFFVKKIDLQGVESFKPEDFAPIISKYENKEVSVDQLKDILAKHIEREYLRRGVIAACFVPPQEVKDGVVILRVVEAKMGELDVKKQRHYDNSRIAYYWTIKPGEVLNYDKISRSLQFMNKNPSREVKATLHAGKEPGTTDVILDPRSSFPLHLTLSGDREGAVSTGKLRKGMGLVENNMFGLDDVMIVGYTGGKSFGSMYGFHKIPITNFGTTVLYGYTNTRAFPKKDLAQYGMSSSAEGISLFLYQDLYKKDEYVGEVSFGFDAKNKHVVVEAGTLNYDRLRIFRWGMSLLSRGATNVAYVKGDISEGVNGFGAKRRSVYSSRNAPNIFSKVNVTSTFRQNLVKNLQASLKVTGQAASTLLMPQEQLYMGGIDSVRGYPSGDYLADTGFVTNMELLVPAFMIPKEWKLPFAAHPLKDDFTGVLFFDYGYGTKRGSIQGEQNKFQMASAGAGVRIRVADQATLRLEWGVVLKEMANRPITENPPYRMHISLDFQDRIPQEIDRLKNLQKDHYIKEEAWKILDAEMKEPKSRLREKIYYSLALAKKAEGEGDLKLAKAYYEKVSNIGRIAYRQAEVYMKESFQHVEELRRLESQAEEYSQNGQPEKAKELLNKIVENGKIKPLILEIS